MEEIAQQFREELQEIIDRYKTRLSVPRIMYVAQDVFHRTLSAKYNPELYSEEMTELKAFRQDCIKLTEDNVIMASQREKTARQLIKAKEVIKDLLKCLPKENIEGVYEVTEAAEEFLRNGDYNKPVRSGSEPNAFRGPNTICSQGPDGCCATYKGGWDKCKGCGMYHGDNKCID